jgi:Tfp pilus assembly PilM family ATPase
MKGILLYQRVIEIAGRHLKEFLMESEKLSPVDATMQLHGLQLPDPQAMEKSLRDYPRTELLFSRLINEIALTFKFFQESWNRTLRYPIWLTGGLASVKGIEPFFSGVYKLDAKKLELQKEQISFSTDFAAFPGFLTKKGGE